MWIETRCDQSVNFQLILRASQKYDIYPVEFYAESIHFQQLQRICITLMTTNFIARLASSFIISR